VLSSHLLDEVERTCGAVAIVDRGKVIRQGPISQLLAGSSDEVQVECSDPDRARRLLKGTTFVSHLHVGTTISDVGASDPDPSPAQIYPGARGDHRGSWIPTGAMVATRFIGRNDQRVNVRFLHV
jgi:ABC-type multidrug transport system ATPase subunit